MNCWIQAWHCHLLNLAVGCLFIKGSVPHSLRNLKQENKGKRRFRTIYDGESRHCVGMDKGTQVNMSQARKTLCSLTQHVGGRGEPASTQLSQALHGARGHSTPKPTQWMNFRLILWGWWDLDRLG